MTIPWNPDTMRINVLLELAPECNTQQEFEERIAEEYTGVTETLIVALWANRRAFAFLGCLAASLRSQGTSTLFVNSRLQD